jgi:hypothetical protein
MFKHNLIRRSLAGGLVIAAAGFPAAAGARLNLDPPASVTGDAGYRLPSNFRTHAGSGGYFSEQPNAPSASVSHAGSGFQWGDAGIGAAGATVVLLSAGALGAGAARRRRPPVVG